MNNLILTDSFEQLTWDECAMVNGGGIHLIVGAIAVGAVALGALAVGGMFLLGPRLLQPIFGGLIGGSSGSSCGCGGSGGGGGGQTNLPPSCTCIEDWGACVCDEPCQC